jgi:uncharacterized protein YjbJ (UPF0337 family)
MVDNNYIEGTAQNVAGKLEEAAGYVTGSPGARIEGRMRQFTGQAQAAYGRAAEGISKTPSQVRTAARHRPISALLIAAAVGFMLGRMSVRG